MDSIQSEGSFYLPNKIKFSQQTVEYITISFHFFLQIFIKHENIFSDQVTDNSAPPLYSDFNKFIGFTVLISGIIWDHKLKVFKGRTFHFILNSIFETPPIVLFHLKSRLQLNIETFLPISVIAFFVNNAGRQSGWIFIFSFHFTGIIFNPDSKIFLLPDWRTSSVLDVINYKISKYSVKSYDPWIHQLYVYLINIFSFMML